MCVRRFSTFLRFGTHANGMPFGGVKETAASVCSERQQEAEQLGLLFLILPLHPFFF